ncbi:MAG: proteasome subunit alpha [Nitrospira sp.]|nr:proteasome subunit alpha [Nitrospira sp.]
MYEEPYRWIEAIGNRRQYLDGQFRQGSPVIGIGWDAGILLMTTSKGTPKLYEIYDRLALGGMGHPADLEKLRFHLLEMAHVEGFNRSPSDVTGGRIVKYGIAPVIKQAFEEVFKAPFIVKILLAELGQKVEKDRFLTVNFDGTFEEKSQYAVLAASPAIEQEMAAYLRQQSVVSLEQAVNVAVCSWAVGDRAQRQTLEESRDQLKGQDAPARLASDSDLLYEHIRQCMHGMTIECALLDRHVPVSSKYRALAPDELERLLPNDLGHPTT